MCADTYHVIRYEYQYPTVGCSEKKKINDSASRRYACRYARHVNRDVRTDDRVAGRRLVHDTEISLSLQYCIYARH